MPESTKRITLPSGGWWELRVRPTVRDSLAFQRIGINGSDPAAGDDAAGIMQTVTIIAQLTTGWGDDRAELPTADDVLDLDMEDMKALGELFSAEVVPFLEALQGSASPRISSSPSKKVTSRRRTPRSS
jgi:hypothetical protein